MIHVGGFCEFDRKTIVIHQLYFVPILHSYYSAYLKDLKCFSTIELLFCAEYFVSWNIVHRKRSVVSDDPHIINTFLFLAELHFVILY